MPDPDQHPTGFAVFCGLDVGKSEHHAYAVDTTGKRLHDKALPNDESALRTVLRFQPRDSAKPGASQSHQTQGASVRICERLEMGPESYIGALVWANAVRRGGLVLRRDLVWERALVLGRAAGPTRMHFVDCCDRGDLEDSAILGCAMGQILTHGLRLPLGQPALRAGTDRAYTVVGRGAC